jgi:hypothetical protein
MRADKGNVSVIMQEFDYDLKIPSLLSAQDTYEDISRHSTEVLQFFLSMLL